MSFNFNYDFKILNENDKYSVLIISINIKIIGIVFILSENYWFILINSVIKLYI